MITYTKGFFPAELNFVKGSASTGLGDITLKWGDGTFNPFPMTFQELFSLYWQTDSSSMNITFDYGLGPGTDDVWNQGPFQRWYDDTIPLPNTGGPTLQAQIVQSMIFSFQQLSSVFGNQPFLGYSTDFGFNEAIPVLTDIDLATSGDWSTATFYPPFLFGLGGTNSSGARVSSLYGDGGGGVIVPGGGVTMNGKAIPIFCNPSALPGGVTRTFTGSGTITTTTALAP